MLTSLRALIVVGSAGSAGLVLHRRARADSPPSFRDDGIKFAAEDLTDKWIDDVIANDADEETVDRARALRHQRESIRRTCPPIPPRSSWPQEVTDEEVTEAVARNEEFALSREELIQRGREVYVKAAIKLAEIETPLGLQAQDRANVERSAMEDGVVEDLLSPVDRHKHGWHRCWQDYWELKKAFHAISKVYSGTKTQFKEIMSVSERNLIEHERFAECMSTADVAENDELYTQATEREELLAEIAKSIK